MPTAPTPGHSLVPPAPSHGHVLVTGAGFTRALAPRAPLLIDDFDNDALAEKVRGLPNASRLLEWERNRHSRGHINIERLMTRLDALMPYDYAPQAGNAVNEYALLLSELKRAFLARLHKARQHVIHHAELSRFARYCTGNGSCCITFNYDDFLDEALASTHMWSSEWGYGFFCPSSFSSPTTLAHSPNSFQLLKLHGSVNWRPKLGHSGPVAVDAITHHHDWSGFVTHSPDIAGQIAGQLEPESVIVLPVLTKTNLAEQPVLRIVWSNAFSYLQRAREVTFLGYSFPSTDIASRTLFTEALQDLPRDRIRVVNLAGAGRELSATRDTYRTALGDIPDARFHFAGALDWIQRLPNRDPVTP